MSRRLGGTLIVLGLPMLLSACGGSQSDSSATSTARPAVAPATTAPAAPPTAVPSPAGPGALQGEALSAAAGDIPDNQVFVRYTGPAFAMKVPEGWARLATGAQTTFRDKNNIARVVVQPGVAPTIASVRAELAHDAKARVTTAAHRMSIGGSAAIAATYRTTSAPNAVTGKSVTLTVDRYVLAKGGKAAVVDLGTPVGVDNVDAYRLMIESLRLR